LGPKKDSILEHFAGDSTNTRYFFAADDIYYLRVLYLLRFIAQFLNKDLKIEDGCRRNYVPSTVGQIRVGGFSKIFLLTSYSN
jgi:hypothetical protein